MKHAAFLLGAILLFVTTSSAQNTSANSLLFAPSDPGLALAEFWSVPTEPLVLASAEWPASTEPPAIPTIGSESSSEPPAQQPKVLGVFETISGRHMSVMHFFVSTRFPVGKKT